MAILMDEPEAKRFALAIAHSPRRSMSSATWLEVSMAITLRHGEEGVRSFDLLAAKLELAIIPFTHIHATIARRAFIRYGKSLHTARLNFGDCMAYALAKETGEPLLFKGEDFSRTDIEAAPY